MPTKQAMRAAEVYLKMIDGDDYGDPNHGHSVSELAKVIDRETKLPRLLEAVNAAKSAKKNERQSS